MEAQKSVSFVTLILTMVAGFCDTATFVAGDGIFSAHVTGNFIVFAAQIVDGKDAGAYIKLLTFPVFIVAVMAGGWLIERGRPVLLVQSIVLLIAGLLALAAPVKNLDQQVLTYLIVMLAVFALGLQNAFGKLFAKATHGPSTMMTGNVTQASLDLGTLIRKGASAGPAADGLKRQGITIGGFLSGCIAGALLGRQTGLVCLVLPGIAMMLCYFTAPRHQYTLPKS
jgi:uncharacterized membrane protein YoaK (UPF0700 family)